MEKIYFFILACCLGITDHTTHPNTIISTIADVTGIEIKKEYGYAALALSLALMGYGIAKEKRFFTVIGSMLLVPTLLINYSFHPQGTILFGLTGLSMLTVGILVNEALKGNLSWTNIHKLSSLSWCHTKNLATTVIG
jgi:hypothetical protein